MPLLDTLSGNHGVGPVCHELNIAPSTYYRHREYRQHPEKRSQRERRDDQLKREIQRVYDENFGVYGIRKVWRQLQREGFSVARCTVARLMKAMGLKGVLRGKKVRTTVSRKKAAASDRVNRQFVAERPNQLWVADFTYVNRLCRIKSSSGNILFFMMLPDHASDQKCLPATTLSVDIIAQCVRWYLAYALSLRNLEEIMAERDITVDHSTLHRWVIRLVPLLDKAFRRHKRTAGRRWRMDETYIKVTGQWKYLYRAVDSEGQTIDFLLTARRDAAAALRFFRKAIRHHGELEVVTIDKSGANTAALAMFNADKPDGKTMAIRQNKHLNNLIEQDHRNIKRRIRLMQ